MMTPYSVIGGYKFLGGTYYLHKKCAEVGDSRFLRYMATTYKTMWRHKFEDNNVNFHPCKNPRIKFLFLTSKYLSCY